jgi:cyclopropane-fatty-acyl-phospholipid synthase
MSVIQSRSSGYRGVSVTAARKHYDLPDDFFRIWLGPSLAYSAAMWEKADDTLESAQVRKMDYLVEQARIAPGQRVLDVGCGYGTELTRLLEQEGIGSAVGLTLSQTGADWLRERGLPNLEVRVENWADHRPAQRYDAIISFEAFEHFARPGMSAARKIRGYRAFFERCRSMIEPNGRMLVQTISWGHRFPFERELLRDLYLATKNYPECNPSFLSEIIEASDGLFDLIAVRNDFPDYARTAQAWVANLDADWERSVDLVGGEKTRDFRQTMSTAVRAFSEGWFYLHRLTFKPVERPTGPARHFLINNVLGLGPGPR